MTVTGLLLALVVGLWWASARPAGRSVAAPPATGGGVAPAAVIHSAGTRDAAAEKGTYGDRSSRVPTSASGRFTVLPGRSAPASQGAREVRYTIEVEDGLGLDPTEFADTVSRTLLDERGWQTADKIRWVNVSPQQAAAGAEVDIHVVLASPAAVDKGCAPLDTGGEVSCFNGRHAWLNAQRWATGAYTYGSDLETYRTYQVNHEVGHGLGHGHVGCPEAGRRAPVMLQQTKTLQGCTAWPYPTGA